MNWDPSDGFSEQKVHTKQCESFNQSNKMGNYGNRNLSCKSKYIDAAATHQLQYENQQQ